MAMFTVCKETQECESFMSLRKKLTLVSEKAPELKDFFILHGMSIFTCIVCWLAKNANHNIKTMEKQKFWKPVIPNKKIDTKC